MLENWSTKVNCPCMIQCCLNLKIWIRPTSLKWHLVSHIASGIFIEFKRNALRVELSNLERGLIALCAQVIKTKWRMMLLRAESIVLQLSCLCTFNKTEQKDSFGKRQGGLTILLWLRKRIFYAWWKPCFNIRKTSKSKRRTFLLQCMMLYTLSRSLSLTDSGPYPE